MVNSQDDITAIFAALADPTRREILMSLSGRREGPVGMLAKPFDISSPAISRHLRVLEKARLIVRRREGRLHVISARDAGLKPVQDWIGRYAASYSHSFDALDELLGQEIKE
jgi:DNA-binding transcriptional ArsR family regulator